MSAARTVPSARRCQSAINRSGPASERPRRRQRREPPSPRVNPVAQTEGERRAGGRAGTVPVLHLEDAPLFAALIRSVFCEAGPEFVVEHVCRLCDAVASLHARHCDVIVTDLNVPDSRGSSTVRALHRSAPHVPIVVLSGDADAVTALEARREGADDYIVKGRFSADAFISVIRRLVNDRARPGEDPSPASDE